MGNSYPKGITKVEGDRSLTNAINYLQHSEIFIGIGSGLSWLSWSSGIPTVIISGFSSPDTEPIDNKIIRIFNGSTCNSCFNRYRLDAGDWNWCPDHKGTERQFECTKSITGDSVIEKISGYLNPIERVINESYSLGMIQNRSEITKAAEFFKEIGVKNFMEIGTDQGGTFAIWSKLSEDGIRISLDMPHGTYGVSSYDVNKRDEYLRSLGNNVKMIHGDSHSVEIKECISSILQEGELDFLFIDGDHTYEGVKKDYEDYKKYVRDGGWIGFHDIKDTDFHRRANCRVDLLWNELEGDKVEFIEPSSNFGGIGFIRKQ
jgi:cephalosporin hydroxylase